MNISLVCVPYQTDVARWGNAMGPKAFLDHGLAQQIQEQGFTVSEPVWIELPRAERTRDTVTNLGNIARRTATAVFTALSKGDFVLVLAGDCTHAVGPIGGLAQAKGAAGIVWFDAHGDMNTMETSTTGLWGGMPYAVALGWDLSDWRLAAGLVHPVRSEAAALIGASDLDPAEIEALHSHPIFWLEAQDMLQQNAAQQVQTALHQRANEAPGWYLHIDLDVAGPEELPGSLTPAPYWPPREILLASVKAAVQAVPIGVATIAVYNPSGDINGRGLRLGLDMAAAIVDGLKG
ncbi:MAG TPA: arginase family protein [Ktedonobacteraceae bacterium]|nr:arginase family protein [Ktedonobacteraceae bacterium]